MALFCPVGGGYAVGHVLFADRTESAMMGDFSSKLADAREILQRISLRRYLEKVVCLF